MWPSSQLKWESEYLKRSNYLKERTLEGLFRCPFFFGELTRENAIQILNEAVKHDGESEHSVFRDSLR